MRKDKGKIQIGDKLYEANKSYNKVFEWEVLEIWFEEYWDHYKPIAKCSNGTWTREFFWNDLLEFYDTYAIAEKALRKAVRGNANTYDIALSCGCSVSGNSIPCDNDSSY